MQKQPMTSDMPKWPILIYMLFTYIAAITIFGKGPTYIGIPPVFWGEITMVMGLFWMFLPSSRAQPMPNFPVIPSLLILFFIILGFFILLVDFWTTMNLEAIRDSAMWYYAIFFYIGLRLARLPSFADKFWQRIQLIWLIALIWVTANHFTEWKFVEMSPMIPHRGVRVFSNSSSEVYQHAYLAAMLLLLAPERIRQLNLKTSWFVLGTLIGSFLMFIVQGRAVKIAAGVSSFVGLLVPMGTQPRVWPHSRLFSISAFALGSLLIIAFVFEPKYLYEEAKLERFEELSEEYGTGYWRRRWWREIHEVVQKKNPWFGLGFGESLSIYNPWLAQWGDEHSTFPVRSPHNFNITVYARMGVIGAVLWVFVLITSLGGLMRFIRRSRNRWGPYTVERRKELTFWLVMITATLTNSTFGVLMEGPVLGIWFWFALGFAQGRARSPDGVEGAQA